MFYEQGKVHKMMIFVSRPDSVFIWVIISQVSGTQGRS